MFETAPGSALATWRSTEWPVTATAIITPLAEHRREYLDYEGPVSGDRGAVRRVAGGCHRILQNDAATLVVEFEDRTILRLDCNA